MTDVLIDDVPRLDEAKLSQHLVVYDKTGRVLGHYLPAALYEQLCLKSSGPRASTEELRRRLHEPGGKSLSEIWNDLDRS
jgi:hypothetical protein